MYRLTPGELEQLAQERLELLVPNTSDAYALYTRKHQVSECQWPALVVFWNRVTAPRCAEQRCCHNTRLRR
jgi:hypothetical protein